jgi:hypothetical protein
MRRFQASERAVLRSLDELQRQGRIIRRHGSGTYIAEPPPTPPAPAPSSGLPMHRPPLSLGTTMRPPALWSRSPRRASAFPTMSP